MEDSVTITLDAITSAGLHKSYVAEFVTSFGNSVTWYSVEEAIADVTTKFWWDWDWGANMFLSGIQKQYYDEIALILTEKIFKTVRQIELRYSDTSWEEYEREKAKAFAKALFMD